MTQIPINIGDSDYDPLFKYDFGLDVPLTTARWLMFQGSEGFGNRVRGIYSLWSC